jgi:hypothetical protein
MYNMQLTAIPSNFYYMCQILDKVFSHIPNEASQ